ncbi:MAG: cytochrome-c peroxidase [Limimaricola sp.]|uniref:cytochrome-c peroxidase n=1 Tax=Limimaricola sp. TaxID=2211665 RepID=UPI001D93853F|nr:cytochrome c peroxidase [Limimaricola sp.]MBI1418898.1 cytochrome-c peroxidase [Limimaricola sp.]
MERIGQLAGAVALALAAGAALAADAPAPARPANLPPPITDADYAPVRLDEAKLGQLLFYDPILSGNREVSCATCHNPAFGTSDGVSLGIGDGGKGLGPARVADPENMPEQRVPRNAQALFNLGAKEFTVLFADGRIEADPSKPSGLRTPLDDDMVQGFASVLSAQAMFPEVSPDEMAGHYQENEISTVVRQGIFTGPGGAWDLIARRVAAIPAYVSQFEAVYPDKVHGAGDIAFTDISNAIAAFVAYEWRADASPFDAYLRGTGTLDPAQTRGMGLFYGEAGCSACHSGKFQSDQAFHAMGMPQFGPGKGARFETTVRDEGRYRVTGRPEDLYAFRTPSLRNVTETGPWGHDGAYRDLAAFVRAHADPVAALADYDRSQAILPALPVKDWTAMDNPDEVAAIAAAVKVTPVKLSDAQVADIVAFLGALDDPGVSRLGVPDAVPSGLTVARKD